MFFDMLLQMGIMFEASSTIDANKGSFPSMDTNMRLEFGQSWKGLEAVGTGAVAWYFFGVVVVVSTWGGNSSVELLVPISKDMGIFCMSPMAHSHTTRSLKTA